jgi:hypothetical protein
METLKVRCLGVSPMEFCNREFSIGVREQQFYREREMPLPKRCPFCRAIRRQRKADVVRRCGENGKGGMIQTIYAKKSVILLRTL